MKFTSSTVSNLAFAAACLVLAAVGTQRLFTRQSAGRANADHHSTRGFQNISTNLSIDAAQVSGNPQARLVIVEFTDFECPFCGRFARDTLAAVRKEFVDPGTFKFAFMHLPLPMHAHAQDASVAAECAAAQGKFWPMHEQLFLNQTTLTKPDLKTHATAVGVNPNQFETCLAAGVSPRIQRDIAEAVRLGITGTPTFFLGRITRDGIHASKQLIGTVPTTSFLQAVHDFANDVSSPSSVTRNDVR